MALTARGTAYTIEENGETEPGLRARWYVADHLRNMPDIPLLIYVHGNGGTYTSMNNQSALQAWLIDNGWAVFESDSGSTSNFGNDDAQAANIEGLAWVESRISVGVIAGLGVSMGGVLTYWLASLAPFADRVNHIVIQQGVTDLTYRYTATTSGTQVLGYHYGIGWTTVVDMDAWEVVADGHDPMWTDPSVWEGKKVLQLWDADDPTVVWSNHGEKWVAKYGDVADVEILGTTGQGHSYRTEHLEATYAFLTAITAPPEPPEPTPGPGIWDDLWVYKGLRIVGGDLRLYPLAI